VSGDIVARMRGREPLAVFVLLGIVALEILVTYSRLPARELYHVSGTGISGGAGRVVVFMNFPVAIVAIAALAVALERLRSRGWRVVGVVAAVLCTPVFWPGVVRQSDLDVRWINAPCAVGVALAVVVAAVAAPGPGGRMRGDGLRIGLAIFALLAAPAWAAAELGFFLDGVPLLGRIYETGVRPAVDPSEPAVHHGHHHGMDGVLLVLSALVLSRALPSIRARVLRAATAAYLALMLAYGLGNIANDFWGEQVMKRGWTTWAVPSVLQPGLNWGWAVILAGAAIVWLGWFARERPSRAQPL